VDAVVGHGSAAGVGGEPGVGEPLRSGREDPGVLRVLDALGRRASGEQELAVRSGMSLGEVADALALAELQGLVAQTVGGWARA